MMVKHYRATIRGAVQGVGYRPFVYELAYDLGITGTVKNTSSGVDVEVFGKQKQLDRFIERLSSDAPPLAKVESVDLITLPSVNQLRVPNTFEIAPSHVESEQSAFITPDSSICEECLEELFDRSNRRYHYPFINCTNCGPRFTIVKDIPYDRPSTTMASFVMCKACQTEYETVSNRRFHAQPNGCPDCGPTLSLSVEEAQRSLADGEIIAVKGLGGFHLACDAQNEKAVNRLRASKHRWGKPFAIMVADLASAEKICTLTDEEEKALFSHQRPIVLLRKRPDCNLPDQIAPRLNRIGVMLPYTPLHYLLLANGPSALVMTSGNFSDEPIVYADKDAADRLSPIADEILTHNRPIHMRCDDSVIQVIGGKPHFLRRSRGYAPLPIQLDQPVVQSILAVGGQQKNTFCLANNQHAFLSHHVGGLNNVAAVESFREGINHFQKLFEIKPEVIACDMHPDYYSTQYASEFNELEVIQVQHHHAHVASVMAEHRLQEPIIGVAFDGSGYGTDETIWGGEFFVVDLDGFERVAHLEHLLLPGGEKAIHEPWRVAAGWMYAQLGDDWVDQNVLFCQTLDRSTWNLIQQIIDKDINTPLSSSIGRLFDAVAVVSGIFNQRSVQYEGQAAIELAALADPTLTEEKYSLPLTDSVIKTDQLLLALLCDLKEKIPNEIIATKFHNGIVEMIVSVCQDLRTVYNLNQVALSGGVFQNRTLVEQVSNKLACSKFEIYLNEKVPCNDGGLALGQIAVANAHLIKRKLCV